jgi:hypothetical protein
MPQGVLRFRTVGNYSSERQVGQIVNSKGTGSQHNYKNIECHSISKTPSTDNPAQFHCNFAYSALASFLMGQVTC